MKLRFTKALFDSSEQYVTNVRPSDTNRAAEVVDDLAIMAIQDKRNPDLSAIPGQHSENINAPTYVTLCRDDLAVMQQSTAVTHL